MRILLLLFFFLPSVNYSQEHKIKTFPLGYIVQKYSLAYEYSSGSNGFQFKSGFTNAHLASTVGTLPSNSHKGIASEVEYRRYLTYQLYEVERLFIAPSVGYKHLSAHDSSINDSEMQIVQLGMSLGTDMEWDSGIVADLTAGYIHNFLNSSEEIIDDGINDDRIPGLKFNFAIGYKFN